MRTFILFFIMLLAGQADAQDIFYFTEDKSVRQYDELIDFYIANIDNIVSVNGDSVIKIPAVRVFKANRKTMRVGNYYVQYSRAALSNSVELLDVEVFYIEFDFVRGDYSKELLRSANDDEMFDRPENEDSLKDAIKQRDRDFNAKEG